MSSIFNLAFLKKRYVFNNAKYYSFKNINKINYEDVYYNDICTILYKRRKNIPPVFGVYPYKQIVITSKWLGKVYIDNNNHVEINTPYSPRNRVAHPHILEFATPWLGYRYMLALTGYYNTNEKEENPFLLASNDLENWDLVSDILAEKPDYEGAHNSDVFLAHNPKNGQLIVGWRQSIRGLINDKGEVYTEDSVWYKTTVDGINFSEKKLMTGRYPRSEDINLSPTVIYDPNTDTWNMYNVGLISGSIYGIYHRQSRNLDSGWTILSKQRLMINTIKPWHMEVRWVGNRLVALVADNTRGKKNLYFGMTAEGELSNFEFNNSGILKDTSEGAYKGSFLAEIEDEKIRFIIAWTGDNSPSKKGDKWKLFINKTNFSEL